MDKDVLQRIYDSTLPSNAFFLTVFNFEESRPLVASDLLDFFPDLCFALVAYCQQQKYHIHSIVCFQNDNSKDNVISRLRFFFSGASFGINGFDLEANMARLTVMSCPIYTNIEACVRYIRKQVIEQCGVLQWTFFSIIPGLINYEKLVNFMGGFGSVGNIEIMGEDAVAREYNIPAISRQCSAGLPLYCVPGSIQLLGDVRQKRATANVKKIKAGHKASILWQRDVGNSRRYYNSAVFVLIINPKRKNSYIQDMNDELSKYFGANAKAIKPYVGDIRNRFFVFSTLPDYRNEPGLILTCSENFIGNKFEAAIIWNIMNRNGVFYNVEILMLVTQ